MKFHDVFATTIFFMLLFACNTSRQKQLDLLEVRKSIEAQNAKWLDAMKQPDIAKLISLYTPDATLMPPNAPMLKGTRQIKAYYERMPSRGVKVIKADLKTLELSGKDSTVIEIGQYFMNIERRDTPALSDTGKYTTIWKLQPDGLWRIYADCWNSSKPLTLIHSNN